MTTTNPDLPPAEAPTSPLPRRIRQLHLSTWRGVLLRSGRNYLRDNCTDWAAALTYYGVLALFPSTVVVVALVGLVSDGERTVDTVLDLARGWVPERWWATRVSSGWSGRWWTRTAPPGSC